MDIQNASCSGHPQLLTLEETAALLKVSKSWIYERTRKGAIPHVKLGKYLRFPLVDLLQWIAAQSRLAEEARLASHNGRDYSPLGKNGSARMAGTRLRGPDRNGS